MTWRRTGFQPVASALTAITIASACTCPSSVPTKPPSTCTARVPSWRITPAAIALLRRTRTSRAGCTVAHSGKKTPRRKIGDADPRSELVVVERDRLLRRVDGSGRRDRRVEGCVLRRRRRHGQHPALVQPHVGAERANGGDDPFAGTRDSERALFAEHGARAADARPVAVQEAAVASTRPYAAAFRLQHDDGRRRVALLHGERGPQAGEAAADDADIRMHVARERLGDVVAERGGRFLEPPRRPKRDGQANVSR